MSKEHLVKLPKDAVDPQGFVKLSRAARLLDCSVQKVRNLIDERHLRAYKIAGMIRLKASEFLRWIDIHAQRH